MKKKTPVTVLIMTQNEEANIGYALESVLAGFDQVIVNDSYSTDNTAEIIKKYPEVDFYQHNFEGWAEQRNWMLENCAIRNELVFFLDADEWINNDFYKELKQIINSKVVFNAIYVRRKFIFLGRWLKYSYGHPRILRIFKKEGLYFEGEGAREYAQTIGNRYLELQTKFYHEDHRGVDLWIKKHLNNAEREAALFLSKKSGNDYSNLSVRLKIKLWIRKYIWNKLPFIVKPFPYFITRYIFQRGFLDGKEGFIYCFLHAFWYQMMIGIKVIEKRNERHN